MQQMNQHQHGVENGGDFSPGAPGGLSEDRVQEMIAAPARDFKRRVVVAVVSYPLVFALALALGVAVGSLFSIDLIDKQVTGAVGFLVHLPLLTLQLTGVVALALLFNWVVLWVRGRRWYDALSPAGELTKVQARIGTPKEQPNDPISIGLQWLGNAVVLATLVYSLHMVFDA